MDVSRNAQINRLKKEYFDVLVIGGGATGSGIVLDAALRGYKAALVERGDFSSQTSSHSTKLLHGGVRYLERAFKKLDFDQFRLVKSSLKERAEVMKLAPHLSRPLPIVIPVQSWFQAAYYWAGIKAYDFLSGKHQIGKSRFISKPAVEKYFPKMHIDGLKGGILYFDGQFDDARLNISIVLTALFYGASTANYVKVVDLHHQDGRLCSVQVQDQLSEDSWEVKSKVVVNATGPFADEVRLLDNLSIKPRLIGSIGSHLVLDDSFAPVQAGLLIPKTADGRVLFVLPWQGKTLVGTTDIPSPIQYNPKPTEAEEEYLLEHLEKYLGFRVQTQAIQARWAGIRPLISEEGEHKSAQLSREYVIEKSHSGMYSILGGKWTSYRKMGEELLNRIESDGELIPAHSCQTHTTPLVGGEPPWEGWQEALKDYDQDIQDHLYQAYGTRSVDIVNLARERKLKSRLHPNYPYVEAEVVWAVEKEMAMTPEDILSRRLRLMMLDQKAGSEVFPRVVELTEQAAICRD
jgi:glycerol-3-phosphate dehydrogenase